MTWPIPALALLLLTACVCAAEHPLLPVALRETDAASYRQAVEPVMALSEADMLRVIPEKSGIYFTDCPNCTAGMQEGQFAEDWQPTHVRPWSLDRPLVMRCKYCGHEYPSEQFPMDGKLTVRNPRGETQEYPYWADEKGYRHYFGARLDYCRLRFMETAGRNLGRAYHLTKDPRYARRCALILQRFAEVFPGYCYHFDYPFQDKVIYDGDVAAKDFRSNYRTARWTWWAYVDIPGQLVEAYDLIHGSEELDKLSAEKGHDVKAEIEGFLTSAVQQVMANPDDLSNMSPGMWADIIRAGRVLQQPEWVHTAVGRLERFLEAEFLGDGAWNEGAPSYNAQVNGNLAGVFAAAAGYSDPAGYQHPDTKRRFDNLDLETASPAVARAQRAYDLMRMPNGRLIPVHDTWSTGTEAPLERAMPFLLPAMGLGCLAGGEKEAQWQALLTWSPGNGHLHYDGLSLILFGQGQELLSDLGYTHTRDRAWTLPTAAHNTVVIDHANQTANPTTDGDLRYFSAMPECQVVSVDNPRVYPGLATTYRRTLISLPPVGGAGGCLVDLFEVVGGQQHDYFLHGCADAPGTVTAAFREELLPAEPLTTLVPEGVEFAEARNEGECGLAVKPGWAYGYLRDTRRLVGELPSVTTVEFAVAAPPAKLRAHLICDFGDELVLGRNPAVRGAKENDDSVRDHWRPFAMLRRSIGESVFATVIEPLTGTAAAKVSRLELDEAAMALQIVSGQSRRLVLLRPKGLRTEWAGQTVEATGELAVAWLGESLGGMVVDGRLALGDHSIEAKPLGDHGLLAVDRAAATITVAGEFLPPAGAVVLLDHAGKRVSAYTVKLSEKVAEGSRLTVAEDPGFTWDAAAQTATFQCRPGTTFQGPHVVRMTPTSYFHVRDAQ